MNAKDFSEELRPTRGQWEAIAHQWCRVAGEPIPKTRLEATELVLRLERSDAGDPPPEGAAAPQRPPGAPDGRGSVTAVSSPVGSGRIIIGRDRKATGG